MTGSAVRAENVPYLRAADDADLRSLLAPASIAVVGASTRPDAVGHQVLANIVEGEFTGTVYAVNPKHSSILGVPCVPSAIDLPEAPDLAIIAVPAAHVPEVVRACGARGVQTIVLLSAEFDEAEVAGRSLQDEVLDIVRAYDMRMVGPNCIGVVNTDPAVRLDATFAVLPMRPGALGVAAQSGACGVAMLVAASRSGLGVAQFVSIGNKADVSGNDLLVAWEHDPHVRVIAMYLESIGDARGFVRIARRVGRSKPILAIKSGRSSAGQRAGTSDTAAAASSDVAVDALFAEAGVLRVATMQELLDATRVFTSQPLPAGGRVAIIGNSGGPGILAADAAEAAGLEVVPLDATTQELVQRAVPTAASTQNPVDLGANAQPSDVGAAVRVLLDAAEVDAVLTVFTEIAVADSDEIMSAVLSAAASSDKPLVATQVGCAEHTERARPIDGVTREVPVFTFPEPAAAALGLAHRYARIAAAAPPVAQRPTGIDTAAVRDLVEDLRAAGTDWLNPDDVSQLLGHYGIPVCPQRVAHGADEAAAAAAALGYPVVLKAVSDVVHKTDVGGVRLDIRDEAQLRSAVTELAAITPESQDVLVQPMVPGGVEVIVGAVREPRLGPLVMLGAGGVLADLVDDRTFRLAPLASETADQMISELRLARILDGYRGRPAVSRPALTDVLIRVAALAGDVPEVLELDLNPLICGGDGALVVDARIRMAFSRHPRSIGPPGRR
jgi:acyl-CoA synthetase (NDP forming)